MWKGFLVQLQQRLWFSWQFGWSPDWADVDQRWPSPQLSVTWDFRWRNVDLQVWCTPNLWVCVETRPPDSQQKSGGRGFFHSAGGWLADPQQVSTCKRRSLQSKLTGAADSDSSSWILVSLLKSRCPCSKSSSKTSSIRKMPTRSRSPWVPACTSDESRFGLVESWVCLSVKVKEKEKPKPKYYGTVTPHPDFDASKDASVLRSAIQSKGEDAGGLCSDLNAVSDSWRALDCLPVDRDHVWLFSGVDEDVIVAVLVKRNNEQRQKIKAVYEASAGKVREKIRFPGLKFKWIDRK